MKARAIRLNLNCSIYCKFGEPTEFESLQACRDSFPVGFVALTCISFTGRANGEVSARGSDEGYTSDLEHDRKAVVCNPRVEWVGTGGYWCWADIDDIEIVA